MVSFLSLQHFSGGLDNWDPIITDGLARNRPIILVNYTGVASSTGEPATTFDGIADFISALSLSTQISFLGFSIGGFVAQSVAHRYPELVRRLILVGTGPRNGESPNDPKIFQVTGNPVPTVEDFLYLFFSPSEKSQNAGRNFWDRRQQRQDADPPSLIEVMKAQMSAIIEWS